MLKFVALAHLVSEYALEVTMTVGPSMKPTMNESGDVLLVDKTCNAPWPFTGRISTGDIVVARSPINAKTLICKRVKAMEGERNRQGRLMTAGQVWLEGDNPLNSTDSRDYGPVPEALIEGRVFFRLWPLSSMGFVR